MESCWIGAGGTTVNPTIAKLDSASATATAVAAHYTATLKATGTGASGEMRATVPQMKWSSMTSPTTRTRALRALSRKLFNRLGVREEGCWLRSVMLVEESGEGAGGGCDAGGFRKP